jgi:hypothetical protein
MDEETTRKASDIILELESKVDSLINLVRSLDLNLKILSNKINDIAGRLNSVNGGVINSKSSITIEAVGGKVIPQYNNSFMPPNSQNLIPITAGQAISVEKEPLGFLRTSRPETFDGLVAPVISPPNNEAIVPTAPPAIKEASSKKGGIPVAQRVVDKGGKSIFLADVEIIDSVTGGQVCKTRTNGVGKWMASLSAGNYKVIIRKRESTTKEKMEAIQNISVDGSTSPFELKTLIIKG